MVRAALEGSQGRMLRGKCQSPGVLDGMIARIEHHQDTKIIAMGTSHGHRELGMVRGEGDRYDHKGTAQGIAWGSTFADVWQVHDHTHMATWRGTGNVRGARVHVLVLILCGQVGETGAGSGDSRCHLCYCSGQSPPCSSLSVRLPGVVYTAAPRRASTHTGTLLSSHSSPVRLYLYGPHFQQEPEASLAIEK